MSATILDGKIVAKAIREKVLHEVSLCNGSPGLAVVLVGNDEASNIYVTNKRKACIEAGIASYDYDLPTNTTETQLLKLIDDLNNNAAINGILVQLPLPSHIKAASIIESINVQKDVDGFHPFNMGRLAQGSALLRPCTPFGIMELLKFYDIPVKGKNALVVGASNIVGRPMALELLNAKASVSICHKQTYDLEKHIKSADLIIVATGTKDVIEPSWLNNSQVVVDVGIHRNPDGSIRGDVDFNKAKEKVAFITPVPGGVGPTTIAVLLHNTMLAYKLQNSLKS